MSPKAMVITTIVSIMLGLSMGRLSVRMKWSFLKSAVITYLLCIGAGYAIHLLEKM